MSEQEHIPLEKTVTASKAMEQMNVSYRTLMGLIKEGKLRRVPYPRHKRVIRIPQEDIDRWILEAGPPMERRKAAEEKGAYDGGAKDKRAAA